MTIEEAIQQHGVMAAFEAAAEGGRGNFTPLRNLGLIVESKEIGSAAYRRLSVEEKAQC